MHSIMMTLSSLCILYLSFSAAYGQENGIGRQLPRAISCPAELKEPWSYQGLTNGQHLWGFRYPDCYGQQQSPIAINSKDAVKDENLAKLSLNGYDQPITEAKIENNGHTIEVTPEDGVSRTISVNGGDSYSLRQFHFHWGDANNTGSEHTLDGAQYAMEMHLVHMNDQDQIAVVGIFFEEKDGDNEELQKLVNEFPSVKYKGDETSVQDSIDLNKLLPSNPTSHYRYQGSLTTPGCSEGVTWSVVPDPMPVGKAQMEKFRQLYSVKKGKAKDSCKLVNNYRCVQPLNGRTVSKSQ